MRRTALILFGATLLLRALSIPFMALSYDEAAFAWTARSLAEGGGGFDLYGHDDLFFFPPLFNLLAALLIKFDIERLYAVRIVTTLLASGIPPLIYVLAVRSGLTERAGLIAVALWWILPWGWYLSVVGMVETPMLFLLLLAVYFLQAAVEQGSRRDALLSALALGAAVWTKETAIGATPLFLFALRHERQSLALWGGLFAVLCVPLFAQSFLPHDYDLFYEVTTPLLLWNSIQFDTIVQNWGALHGAVFFPWPGWFDSIVLFTIVVATLSIVAMPRVEWRDRFVLQFAAGFLIIFIPFFMVFPKKFVYYLLPVQLFLSFFVARYLSTRPRFAVVYGAILLAFAAPAFVGFFDRSDEESYHVAFALVEREKPGARIGITLPRKAEYLAEKAGQQPNLQPIEWVECAGKGDACLFRNDYIMSNTMFLTMTYCRHWPISPENCDLQRLAAAKKRLTPLATWRDFNLYRVERHGIP